MTRLFCVAFAAVAVVACSRDETVAKSISQQFKQFDGRLVNLGSAVPGPWERVCVIGPYMEDAAVQATLGFKWDSKKVSNVAADDTIVLLVFVDDADKVTSFTNYPRGKGDFSNLSRQCFTRSHAIFEQVDKPQQGWAGLFPKKI